MSRRAVWVLAGVAAVLLLAAQAGAAVVVWQHTRPRLPSLVPAAALDRAIAAIVSAAGDRAAVAVSGVIAYTACQHTVLARGSRFNRSADLYTDPGTEDGLIATIAAGLPAGYHPARGTPVGGGAAPLTATVDGQVALRVSQLGQGWLEAVAETGCRAGAAPTATRSAAGTAPAAVDRVLATLGTAVDAWHADTVDCPAGYLTTVSAISGTTDTDRLPSRLAGQVPAAAHPFASPANRLAWRDGTVSVIVAASDDGTHVTVQYTTGTGC